MEKPSRLGEGICDEKRGPRTSGGSIALCQGMFRDSDLAHILNVGETFWRVLTTGSAILKTLARVGADNVMIDAVKDGLMVIWRITVSGVSLPLCVICRGRSLRREFAPARTPSFRNFEEESDG
jgi:hypothetical protein